MLKKEANETKKQYNNRVLAHYTSLPLLNPGEVAKIHLPSVRVIETNKEMWAVLGYWKRSGITEVAIDTEFEASFHYKGLSQLCLVQVFDGKNYFLIDGLKLAQKKFDPKNYPLKAFFCSKGLKKIIFSASGDASILRRHKIWMYNTFDIQKLGDFLSAPCFSLVVYLKMFLGVTVMGGKEIDAPEASPSPSTSPVSSPTASPTLTPAEPEEHKELTASELKAAKKKKQNSNWIVRPVGVEEATYALSDVEYLFRLRDVMLEKLRVLDTKIPGVYDMAVKSAVFEDSVFTFKPKCTNTVEFLMAKKGITGLKKELVNNVHSAIVEYTKKKMVLFETIAPDYDVFVQSLVSSYDMIMDNLENDLAEVFRDLLSKFGSTLSEDANRELATSIAAYAKSKEKKRAALKKKKRKKKREKPERKKKKRLKKKLKKR